MTLTTRDAYGNATTLVNSSAAVSVDHSATITPASIYYTQFRDDGAYSGNFIISKIYTDTDVTITASISGITASRHIQVTGVNKMDHFRISGTGSQASGDTQQISIIASTESGDVNSGYTGLHNITFSGAGYVGNYHPTCNGTNFGTPVSLNFVNGVAACTLQIYKSGTWNINATDQTYEAGGYTLSVNVSPLPVSSFDISAPFTVTSEALFTLTVTARDQYGNATSNIPGDISLATDTGTLAPDSITAASFSAGTFAGAFTLSGIPFDATATLTFQCGSITDTKSINVIGVDETGYLVVQGANSQVAGGSSDITVTAYTISGHVDTSYEGSKNITFNGPGSIGTFIPNCGGTNIGTSGGLNFTAGVATCALTIYRAGTTNLNATDGSHSANGHVLNISVSPAPLASFNISSLSTAVSGTPFPVSITARDPYGNATGNIPQDISVSTDQGSITPHAVSAASFSGATYSGNFTVADIQQDSQITMTFRSGNATQSKTITVHQVDEMDHFAISGSPSMTAGIAKNISITAIGISGNTFSAYSGSHSIVFSGANSIGGHVPACNNVPFGTATNLTFTGGVATCNLSLYKSETSSLAASDGSYDTEDSPMAVAVAPAALASFGLTSPDSVTSGTPFSVNFVAQDTFGNTTNNVTDDISITSSAGNLSSATVEKSNFQTNGVYQASLTLSDILQSTSVTLTFRCGSISQNILLSVVGVDQFDHFELTGSSTETAGQSQEITVTAIGQSGEVYTAYTGEKNLLFQGADPIGTYIPTCSVEGGQEFLFGSSANVNFQNGIASLDMKLYKAGSPTVSVRSNNYASSGHDLHVEVSPASIYSFAGSVPTVAVSGTPFLFTLTAKDQFGNTTTDVGNPATLSTDHGTMDPDSVPADEFRHDGTFTREVTVSDIHSDTPVTMVIKNGDVTQNASLLVTGVDYMDHLKVTSLSSEITAGSPVSVDISIIKADGEVYSDFSGDKIITLAGADTIGSYIPTFTDKDARAFDFGQSAVLTFVNGVATSHIILYKSGRNTVLPMDNIHGNDVPLFLSVVPAGMSSLSIDSPSSVDAKNSFPLTITAWDIYGNATNPPGDIILSSDHGRLSSTTVPMANFTSGFSTLDITLSDISKDGNVVLTASSGAFTANKTIAVKAAPSGSGFIPPKKPDISKIKLSLVDGAFYLSDLPKNIVQFAVSGTSNFQTSSWHLIKDVQSVLGKYIDSLKFFMKFRGSDGGVSDPIIYQKEYVGIPLSDGDIVKTKDNPDVYIIKIMNGKQYKRLILSPHVFSSYGHLKWENLKVISGSQMDEYMTSDLVQVKGDRYVYELFPEGDTGERKIWDTDQSYDPDSVYEINAVDRDSYVWVK